MADDGDHARSTSPAEAYDRHVGRYGKQLAAGLIEAAGVRSGQRALDVGCGPGQLTTELAELLGGENVAAVDPSEAFVEACRKRAPGSDVQVGTGERLPFASGEFDAVLAQLVVQLMEDSEAGVREMARAARTGGVVAASVWDSNTMPLLRSVWDAALAVAPERAGALDEGQRVGYDSPRRLGTLWERSGLRHIDRRDLGRGRLPKLRRALPPSRLRDARDEDRHFHDPRPDPAASPTSQEARRSASAA